MKRALVWKNILAWKQLLMKKVIVTGALGYLGSKLIEHLLIAFPEIEILAIDDLSSGNPKVLDLAEFPCAKLIRGDILDLNLPVYFENAQTVFHLAAVTDPSASFEDSSRVYRVNTEGTRCVAEACIKTGTVLVFPSTTSIYTGNGGGPIIEDEAERWAGPQTPYADSKLKAEEFLEQLAASSKLRYSTLRLGTVFGVSKGMHFRTAVQKFCLEAATSGTVTVWESSLDQRRPYCEIEDAVRAMIFLAENSDCAGKMFHAASDHATVRKLTELLKDFFPQLQIDLVKHQAMNLFSYEVSCECLKKLGFQFKGSLRLGIEAVIRHQESTTKKRLTVCSEGKRIGARKI